MKKIATASMILFITVSCKVHNPDTYYSDSGENLEESAVVAALLCNKQSKCYPEFYSINPGKITFQKDKQGFWVDTICHEKQQNYDWLNQSVTIHLTKTAMSPAKTLSHTYPIRMTPDNKCVQIGAANQQQLEELCRSFITTQDFLNLQIPLPEQKCTSIVKCSDSRTVFCNR